MQKKRCKLDAGRFISGRFWPIFTERSQKGQVTVFIILGMILLIAIILVFILRREITVAKPEEILPSQVTNVENLVTACLAQVGDDGMFRMGEQGGYIEVPAEIINDGSRHLRTSSITIVPYWAYGENTAVPTIQQLQERLNLYLESNLRNCVFGTGAFSEKYDFIEKSGITADTNLLDNKIVFNVNWDLEIRDKAGEVIVSAQQHKAESPIRLKSLRDLGQSIIEREMKDFKLEDLTQDLISLENPNLPVAGMDFSCTPRSWSVAKAKSTMQEMLRVNLQELKIRGTDYVEFPDSKPYYQNHYVWDLGEDLISKDVSAQFRYDNNFPFSFDATPRSGSYLYSNQAGGKNPLLSFFCLQTWKFSYDVGYPVLVTLTDETTGYNFKFSLTVHLGKNIPDRAQQLVSQPVSLAALYQSQDFCQRATIPIKVNTYKLVDNGNGVYFRDPLAGVDLAFTCLTYSCDLGQTEYNVEKSGDIAYYQTNFPQCVGGILRGKENGFKENWVRVTTAPGDTYELNLMPLKEISATKITILHHEYDASTGKIGIGEPLQNDETALITLSFQKKDSPVADHEDTVLISSALEEKVLEQDTLQLLSEADYTYRLKIDLFKDSNYLGGYQSNWTVPWVDLASTDSLTFHVPSKAGMDQEETADFVFNLEENSKAAPLPEFK